MKKNYVFITVILWILIFTSISRASISEFNGAEYNFVIRENADYTHYQYDNAMITVRSQEEWGYGISDVGGNDTESYWISGVQQIYTKDKVKIGNLRHGGFSANFDANNSAIIQSFNLTIPIVQNYVNEDVIEGVPFSTNESTYIDTVGEEIFPAALVMPILHFFVSDEISWITSFYNKLNIYRNDISDKLGITPSISTTDHSITFDISGSIPDIHQYTDHGEHFNSSINYNRIDVSGGFTISYDSKGILNDYSTDYEITYQDVKIMDYSKDITRESGLPGNRKIGNNPDVSSFFNIPMFIIGIGLFSYILQKFFSKDD